MIYFYEFLKGSAWAIFLFGPSYLFLVYDSSFLDLFIGALPGFILLIIIYLLIENHELRQYYKGN